MTAIHLRNSSRGYNKRIRREIHRIRRPELHTASVVTANRLDGGGQSDPIVAGHRRDNTNTLCSTRPDAL